MTLTLNIFKLSILECSVRFMLQIYLNTPLTFQDFLYQYFFLGSIKHTDLKSMKHFCILFLSPTT